MKTVATFREAYQAHLAKGKLEAEGISAIVLDEYLVGINWMYSQAIGGIKVQVSEADYEQACRILKEDFAEDLGTQYSNNTKDTCPACGSSSVFIHPYSRWWLIPSLFFLVPIFYRRKQWKCKNCGAVW